MQRDLWLGIEMRHFAALEAVALEHSFRGAARRLGYVQSAISRQIATLEKIAGVRLIERSCGPAPVRLTEAGELLLHDAHEILAIANAAKCAMGQVSEGHRPQVRLGLFPGVPLRILPPALTQFASRHPDVRVSTIESPSDRTFGRLLVDGRIDLAFVWLPSQEPQLETCELMRVPLALMVQAQSELAARSTPPTLAELARLPLIGAKTAPHGASIEAQLRAEGGPPRIVFRSDVADTARALVAAGVGAAIVPCLAVERHDPLTCMVDLGDLFAPLRIGIARHARRQLPETALAFREIVCDLCCAGDEAVACARTK